MANLFALPSDGSDDHSGVARKGEFTVSIQERIEGEALRPQLTEVVGRALKATSVLQLSGDLNDAMTDLVATRIIELAKCGGTDSDRLCGEVLMELAERLSSAAA
jgi:hypothetical protein